MIFASDLDRTLMYSNRAIKELGEPRGTVLKPVEQKNGSWLGYMTEASYIALKELSNQSLFIPVTTRTTEQFNRFVIFSREIPIKYAITTNGAYIFENGAPLLEWTEHIKSSIQADSTSQEELLAVLEREGFRLNGEKKDAENLFFYYLLNDLPIASEKELIHGIAVKYGWRISLQGRKLYFIPKAISKGNALEYICNREGKKAAAGAGDSILDWDFLQHCQYRFVPNHGELAKELAEVSGNDTYILTNSRGAAAGEEILQQFLNLLPLKI